MTEALALFRVATPARRARMTPRTLRYYEEIGLLPAATRSDTGQRLYSDADVDRMRRIEQLRESVGLSLAEIREWLGAEAIREALRDRYHHSEDPETRRRAVGEAMKVLERQLTVLRRKRAILESLEVEYTERLQRMGQVLAEGATPASPE